MEKKTVDRPASSITNADLTSIYSQAIADLIDSANKNNNEKFDTLYIVKRKLGQADDFPDILLPKTIEQTEIRLVTREESSILQSLNKSNRSINLFCWVKGNTPEFMFVIFSSGFSHQEVYNSYYSYNVERKEFELQTMKNKTTIN